MAAVREMAMGYDLVLILRPGLDHEVVVTDLPKIREFAAMFLDSKHIPGPVSSCAPTLFVDIIAVKGGFPPLHLTDISCADFTHSAYLSEQIENWEQNSDYWRFKRIFKISASKLLDIKPSDLKRRPEDLATVSCKPEGCTVTLFDKSEDPTNLLNELRRLYPDCTVESQPQPNSH